MGMSSTTTNEQHHLDDVAAGSHFSPEHTLAYRWKGDRVISLSVYEDD